MIFKIIKRDTPFVMIDKRIAEDERLSYKAKGLMMYLLSRPPDWIVRRDDLIARSTDGREAVQSGMSELKDIGYAELVDEQDIKGRMKGKRWIVAESPELLQETLVTLGRLSRPTGLPANGKAAPTNKEDTTKSEGTNIDGELDLGIEIEYGQPSAHEKPSAVDRAVMEARLDSQCLAIYQEYPKKCNRGAALKAIRKALKEIDYEWLYEKVRDYAICRAGEDPQFTRNPDNWFRDGNYMDDPSLWRAATRFPASNLPTSGSSIAKVGLSANDRRKQWEAANG